MILNSSFNVYSIYTHGKSIKTAGIIDVYSGYSTRALKRRVTLWARIFWEGIVIYIWKLNCPEILVAFK